MVEVTGILAAIGGIVAILIAFLIAYGRGRSAGSAERDRDWQKQSLARQSRIDEAIEAGPRSAEDAIQRLREGGRL